MGDVGECGLIPPFFPPLLVVQSISMSESLQLFPSVVLAILKNKMIGGKIKTFFCMQAEHKKNHEF